MLADLDLVSKVGSWILTYPSSRSSTPKMRLWGFSKFLDSTSKSWIGPFENQSLTLGGQFLVLIFQQNASRTQTETPA